MNRQLCKQLHGLLGTAVCACLLPALPAPAAEVGGSVVSSADQQPIAGAIVTLQTSDMRTTADENGVFAIDLPEVPNLKIVAAAKGFFNEAVIVTPPATGILFQLDPVPQDDDPNYQIMPPTTCGACHPDQLAEWLDTPMANAGLNTWVADIYNGTGTAGGMGGFVYTRDSVFAASNPASECAACHQPELWIANPGTAQEDPSPLPSDAVVHGISCEVCHKIADVNVANINYPGVIAGSLTLTRPAGSTPHQVQYGVLGDTDYNSPFLMRPSYQPQLVAEVCGACHQDKNDIHEDHTFDGVISEPTYLEWIDSPYADPNSGSYASCVDCHMGPSDANRLCEVLFPPLERTGIKSHTILGTTPAFLENAVELTMQAQVVGNELAVDVTVHNAHTGHHVPTGVTVRNMILVVEAWPAGDDPFASALTHTGTQTVHELGGVGDPAEGYYAGLPGKFFAKVNHNASGNGPTFFTDATGIQFDSRLPALATDVTNYTFALPNGGGPIQVRARLIYRRAFRFLVDAKGWTEDGHGNPLGDMQPPHYGHLMEQTQALIQTQPLGACCRANGVCTLQAESDCGAIPGQLWAGPDTDCTDADGNGAADACEQFESVPTVSEWGLVILALSLLVLAKLCNRRAIA